MSNDGSFRNIMLTVLGKMTFLTYPISDQDRFFFAIKINKCFFHFDFTVRTIHAFLTLIMLIEVLKEFKLIFGLHLIDP
ncbi:MAG: hypothetical protein EB154_07655, partial [Nitrosopumilaceae archaeon]|nr:hypothetical protein [Nitrosopumilaceae archaeon]